MNSENTTTIKKVLEEACGGTGGPSEGWRAEGVERLFLDEFGAEGFRGGCVEVRHGESNSESVRMELELSPALAAQVIALVTKNTLGELPDLTEPEKTAIAECVAHDGRVPAELADGLGRQALESLATQQAPEEIIGGEPNAARMMRDEFRGHTAAIRASESEEERRKRELAELILSQRKDQEIDEEEKEAPSEDLPEELNFDPPEEKERVPRD